MLLYWMVRRERSNIATDNGLRQLFASPQYQQWLLANHRRIALDEDEVGTALPPLPPFPQRWKRPSSRPPFPQGGAGFRLALDDDDLHLAADDDDDDD